MNRSGIPCESHWVKSGRKDLNDVWRWESVDHCDEIIHIFQVLEVRCNVQVGDTVHWEEIPYEICHVWYAHDVADGKSILIFAHPKVQPLTEDEWHELYGHMDLAPRS